MDVGAGVGIAGYRRTYHIAYAINESSLFAGYLNGGQGVGGFARLRHGYHHILICYHRFGVAEFRSIFHFHGNAAELLNQRFSQQRGMPRCAAGHYDDSVGVQELILIAEHAVENHLSLVGNGAAADTVAQRVRLLKNLLQHEVRIAAFLQLRDGPFKLLYVNLRFLVLKIDYAQRLTFLYDCYLLVVNVNHIFGAVHKRSGV